MQEWHKLLAVARTWAAFKAMLLAEQKSERDNRVAPASAYTNNSHRGASSEALNNLAAATTADRQAVANQSEAVENLSGANQQLANQIQQAQQYIQHMMSNLYLPGSAPTRSYQPPPPKNRARRRTYPRTRANKSRRSEQGPRKPAAPRNSLLGQ